MRSLHTKLVMILVLLILSLMTVVGAFLINSVTAFYLEDFYTQMSEVFQKEELYADLTTENEKETSGEADGASMMAEVLGAYAGELGVDGRNRKLYILDDNGVCLIHPNGETGPARYTTNLSHALSTGEVGDRSNVAEDYMDVAIPIQRGDQSYVIYIYDNKTTANNLTDQMFLLIMEALVFGLVISVLLSFLLSKTMVTPIQRLTEGAMRVAEGDFSRKIEVASRDEETGTYFRCLSEVASQRHLTEALAGLSGNGSFYAFESEQYRMLDRDTLITEQPPASAVYTAANPMNRGQDSLKELMGDLGISVNGSNFYLSGSEEVVRSGDGSIRLSSDGVAVYAAGEGGPFKIPPRNGKVSLFDAVEACRQVAANTLGTRSGQARLYLMSARETETGLVVRFGYCLNGYLVRLDQGYAAQFLVRDGEITDFTLCFRSYTDSGTTSPVLPIRQAAAAMEAMGLTGEELLLAYSDSRGDTVTASWMAADSHLTERG